MSAKALHEERTDLVDRMDLLKRVLSPRARWLGVLVIAAAAALSGCRSRAVDTTIVNQGPAIRLLEFDYPDASFGIDQLPSGGRYNYNFQIKGSGPLALSFTDASGKVHTAKGPGVHLGQEGSLLVTIGGTGSLVTWLPKLH